MESRSHAIAAGLFVVAFVAAALFSLWWFSGKAVNQREVLVVAKQGVNGLNAQGAVRYRGVRVGKVREIVFDPAGSGDIHVAIAVADTAPVSERTIAKLAFQGVTGQAHLQLEDAAPGSKFLPLPQDGDVLRIALAPSLVSESIDSGVETLKQVREITTRINALLAATDANKVARTLDHIEKIAGNAAEASAQLPDAVARLKKLASEENLGRLNLALKNAADASGRVSPLLDETRAVATTLRAVADRLDTTLVKVNQADFAGLGQTPGKINTLSDQVAQTVGSLDRLIKSLEESPQSLVFGRSPREPGPGEAGFGEKK
jgi:phospholipid/cholesterol/gamma-HCH transport system substrate-binding protein